MKKGLTLFAAILTLLGCNSQKKSEANEETKTRKCLVIYYSQTGATQQVAREFARLLEADTLRIDAAQPYNGTYDETIERCKVEMANNELPELAAQEINLDGYDVVFLGYPIWFGTYAPPVATLVKNINFAGKKIVPFCTFGSGGLASSMADLKAALPDAEILPGYGVRNARIAKAPAEVERFLKENGFIGGEYEKLPEFSAQEPVTDAEVAIFNAACGDYKYPLGTPVMFGKRMTSAGTEYRFTAQSKGANGNDVEAVIYVIVGNGADEKPEFTEVVR